jgi:hypothetical protein
VAVESRERSEVEPGVQKKKRRLACEDLKCDWKILCVILVVIEVQVSVLRSVATRRLVETENPSACVTVNWNVCKSAIAPYCLY